MLFVTSLFYKKNQEMMMVRDTNGKYRYEEKYVKLFSYGDEVSSIFGVVHRFASNKMG